MDMIRLMPSVIRVAALFVFAYSSFHALRAQPTDQTLDEALANISGEDFFELQEVMNSYFERNPGAAREKHWRRSEWFLEPRLFPEGEMVNIPARTAMVHDRYTRSMANMPMESQRAPHGGWLFLGPTDWSTGGGLNWGLGRVNCVDFNPTNDNIMYVGTASGGVWRTLNGGTSWTNISPNIPLLSITDLVIHPTSSATIWALTGDGDPVISPGAAHTSPEYASMGIIKTTDGGDTWYPTGFNFGYPGTIVPNKLIAHPTNPNIQFVASNSGIFKTTDGWANYTQEAFGVVYDIEFRPDDPDIMYASRGNSVMKSDDVGDTWTTVSDPDFAIFNSVDRIELAVTPDFPTMVYALGAEWGGFKGVLQSLLEGADNSWIIKDSTNATRSLLGGQGNYNLAIAVKDTDYRDVFIGLVGAARNYSQAAPGSWTSIANGHADIHEIVYRNGNLYIANDGGLWKSTNDGSSATEISKGIAMTQIYRISGTPLNTNHYIIGAQDVGHHRRTSVSQTFENIGCCDGMISIYNYNDINEIYIAGQNGGINKSTTGGPPFTTINNPGDGGAWITPYIMDPSDPDILFVGKDSVHRTNAGGGTWQYLGSPTTGNLNCMAQGVDNRNRLYVSISSQIWRTNNALVSSGTATWTSVSSGLPNRFITGIAVDPDDADNVYVSMSGYGAGQKVYKSTGGGSGWTNISGALPNVPVNCIVYHDNGENGLYIGTDIGVFYRDDAIGDWVYFSNGLPTTIVNDLYINPTNNTIAAGTWGRGLWLSSLWSTCTNNYTLSGGPSGGTYYYSASSHITSSREYKPDLGVEIHYNAGNYVDLKPGFEIKDLAFFEGTIGPCDVINMTDPLTIPILPSGVFMTEALHTEQDILIDNR